MKLYTHAGALSPRRVALHLAEKTLAIETVGVNIPAGERGSGRRRARPSG